MAVQRCGPSGMFLLSACCGMFDFGMFNYFHLSVCCIPHAHTHTSGQVLVLLVVERQGLVASSVQCLWSTGTCLLELWLLSGKSSSMDASTDGDRMLPWMFLLLSLSSEAPSKKHAWRHSIAIHRKWQGSKSMCDAIRLTPCQLFWKNAFVWRNLQETRSVGMAQWSFCRCRFNWVWWMQRA